MSQKLKPFLLFLILNMYWLKSQQVRFTRTIEAIGLPYYKILMTLGFCKDNEIFDEEKIWPTVRLNRVIDIYYRSAESEVVVSEVDIFLITNNTECIAFSDSGVGSSEFKGTMFCATNMGATYYKLTIFTCDRNESIIVPENDNDYEA